MPEERDIYGNRRPATFDAEHSEIITGVVVGDVEHATEQDEDAPDAIVDTVALYLPKGHDGPYDGCMFTVRGTDYLVAESHVYAEPAVPGPHNAWVRVVRRHGQ
jgi:hypothetical protein